MVVRMGHGGAAQWSVFPSDIQIRRCGKGLSLSFVAVV